MKNIALQLYSVNEFLKDDFYGTLKKVADIGYQYVEFAGYMGNDAKTVKAWLDELGLTAVSNHCKVADIEEEIAFAKVLGMKHLACPHKSAEELENTQEISQQFNEVGKKCAENGIAFSYHNHAHEFEKLNGEFLLDLLYQNTDPQYVKVQADFYWVAYAGEDPLAFTQKYQDRMPTVHCKEISDMENKLSVAVGDGMVDFKGIYQLLGDDTYYIVELEKLGNETWEAAERSFEYLSSL